jgi:hypothetical protein
MSIIIGGGITIGGGINIDTTGGGGGGGAATVTWSSLTGFAGGSQQYGAAYDGSKYVTIGNNAFNYSTNLSTWSGPVTISGGPSNSYLNCLAYGNGVWVATGPVGGGAGYTVASKSTSGTGSWSTPTAVSASPFYSGAVNGKGLVFGNGKFILAGYDTTTHYGYFSTSADGVTWSAISLFNSSTANFEVKNIIYTGSQFVVVGNNTTTTRPFYTKSSDGVTWTTPAAMGALTSQVSDIAYGNGTYVATMAASNSYSTSTDLNSWTTAVNTGNYGINRVVYGNGKFVTAGAYVPSSTTISGYTTSSDGSTWSSVAQYPGESTSTTNFITGLQFVNGNFISLGVDYGSLSTFVSIST